jgi:hypothetical protein
MTTPVARQVVLADGVVTEVDPLQRTAFEKFAAAAERFLRD